jgi:acetoin utilization deacetylase AcuC-like enzyme
LSLLLYSHAACLAHDPGPGHPECPARLATVLAALDQPQLAAGLERREAPRAEPAHILRAHDAALLQRVMQPVPEGELRRLDADTAMSSSSAEATLRAIGGLIAAVDAVMAGDARRAFCATRPPGHHATRDRAMGFCPLNGIACAALHAVHAHGLERVAVVDFDVHHGNGSEAILADDPRTMYVSSHQWPLYPGTGSEPRIGNAVNAILPPGSGSLAFRDAWRGGLLPALDAFAPQLVLVSAGFDAHRLDPLANLNLVADDYAWITAELAAIADRHAEGRMVSTLEGGYSLTALKESVRAHVGALLDTSSP